MNVFTSGLSSCTVANNAADNADTLRDAKSSADAKIREALAKTTAYPGDGK